MKKSRKTESQIAGIHKQAEYAIPIPDLYREHDMSAASFCKWRANKVVVRFYDYEYDGARG